MSATARDAAYPVHVLNEHVTALASAIDDCLKNPELKPVHRLRTGTRRIEGQLALFGAIPEFTLQKNRKRLRRVLKKIRRAAGNVRDLDVQMETIDGLRTSGAAVWKRDRTRLHDLLNEERKAAAEELNTTLGRNGKDLKQLLKKLVKQLEPEEKLALNPQHLAELTRVWFAGRVAVQESGTDDPDQLHAIRKAAKLARYIAENAPNSANPARAIAERFEAVQEAGGRWHDDLILAGIARERLGASSQLTQELERRCLAALKRYQKRLHTTLGQISSAPLRLTPLPAAGVPARRARILRRA